MLEKCFCVRGDCGAVAIIALGEKTAFACSGISHIDHIYSNFSVPPLVGRGRTSNDNLLWSIVYQVMRMKRCMRRWMIKGGGKFGKMRKTWDVIVDKILIQIQIPWLRRPPTVCRQIPAKYFSAFINITKLRKSRQSYIELLPFDSTNDF